MVTPPQLETSAAAHRGRSGLQHGRALTRRGVLSRLPLIAATVAALWGVGCLTGCVDQWVKTDVPREVQKGLGAPARVPLSQARSLAEEWRDMQEAEAKKLAAEEKINREAAAAEAARIRAEVEDRLAAEESDIARVTREGKRALEAFDQAEAVRAATAEAALKSWAETAAASGKRFASSIAAAESQAASFGGVLGDVGGLVQGAANSSGVPGLGIIVAGVLGLLIRKPGDSKRIAEAEKKAEEKAESEWQHGYRAGLLADPNRSINSTTLPTVSVNNAP